MPKSLVLGNGNILVCMDKFAQLKDFYFHYVGLENHIGGEHTHRIGVMVNGNFSWISDGNWNISVRYQPETMVSDIKAINNKLGVELHFSDIIYNEKNIFVRRIRVKNLNPRKCEVKVFLHQQFKIYNTEIRDTAYFDPDRNVIVHYEGRRVFMIGADCEGKSFDDFSTGIYGILSKEGTWRDAEDGVLDKNPVEHGPVDSVIGFTLEIEPNENKKIYYWITAGKKLDIARELHEYVLKRTPKYLIRSTRDFWKAWVNKNKTDFHDLDDEIIDLFKKSLLIIRTHVGNRGGIIASGDSDMLQYGRDTYAYVWPRDAALIALALDKTGYSSITRSFFEFSDDVISKEGYFFHKYRSDRSIGSSWHPWFKNGKKQLAIQEDETALVIFALWEHYQTSLDLQFIENVYNSLIKKAADFMCGYRDLGTGLPKHSYDLWEQEFGVSTFTASAVYGGLIAASKFAELLGKDYEMNKYRTNADEIRMALLKYLYNEENQYFYRYIQIEDGKIVERDDTVDMSGFHGLQRFGVLESDDERMKKAYEVVNNKLSDKSHIGGVMRYERDDYHQIFPGAPGNPWFITTFWLAQYEIACAKNKESLELPKGRLKWGIDHALQSGVLGEQLRIDNGDHVSASPLTWSHAEFIFTVKMYLDKVKEFDSVCS